MNENLSLLEDLEVVTPMYVNVEYIETNNFKSKLSLMRFNYNHNRFYANYNFDSQKFKLIKGTTSYLHNIIVENDFFKLDFIQKHGQSGWHKFLNEKAKFGTFMHNEINYYINNKSYDLEIGKMRLETFYQKLNPKFYSWYSMKDDYDTVILAFIAFLVEYQVEPIFIEYAGAYIDEDNNISFAGAIDLFCKVTTKEKGFGGEVYKSGVQKGEPKETYQETTKYAIVDFKSGTAKMKSHPYQLKMYDMIIRQNFGINDDEEILLLNVYRKEFKSTTPSATVVDNTNKVPKNVIEKLISAHTIMNDDTPNEFRTFDNVINADNIYSIGKMIDVTDYLMKFEKTKNYINLLQTNNIKVA